MEKVLSTEVDYSKIEEITRKSSAPLQRKLQTLTRRKFALANEWKDRLNRNMEDWTWAKDNHQEDMQKELRTEIMQNCQSILKL